MNIHHIELHKAEELFKRASALENMGYRFHITAREWRVRNRFNDDLKVKTVIPDGDDGGLSSREYDALAHQNLLEAIQWAHEHAAVSQKLG